MSDQQTDQTPDPFERFHMRGCSRNFLTIDGYNRRCDCGLDAARDAERQQHQQTIQQQAAQIETLTQALERIEVRLKPALRDAVLFIENHAPDVHEHGPDEHIGRDCAVCDSLYIVGELKELLLDAALAGASRPTEWDYTEKELACRGCMGPCGRCYEEKPTEGEQGRLGNYYGRRLTASVEDGQVLVAIGVQTLAHAVAYADWANPFDETADDYIRAFAIADAGQFAKDVVNAMLAEREDGSTPLSDFLDKMSQAAIEDGSLGLHEDEHRIKHGETAPCETWATGEQGAPTLLGLPVLTSERMSPDSVALVKDQIVSPPPTPDVERLTWQPIATAPKDGTTVLLWWESEIGEEVVEFYGCGRWREFGDGSKGWSGESIHASEKGYWTRLIGEQPTHWMPLPDRPVAGDTPTPGGEQP